MAGMKVISSSAAKNRIIIGYALRASSIIGMPESDEATNRLTPIGGVTNPIARFTTMMIPKWMGSTPNTIAAGSKIGVSRMMAGVVSSTIPTNSRMILITKRMITKLVKSFAIHVESA